MQVMNVSKRNKERSLFQQFQSMSFYERLQQQFITYSYLSLDFKNIELMLDDINFVQFLPCICTLLRQHLASSMLHF